MKNLKLAARYRQILENWIPCAEQDIVFCPDRPDLCYYGDGTNGWGVQTNQKALAAYAVLAVSDELDETRCGLNRETILARALGMLRYSLESHIVGSYHTTDADDFHWGHTWISSLGVERMMHGVMAIRKYMTADDEAALRAMLISESDWILTEYPVKAGLVQDNKPESNMWNGSVLWRTAVMYPDAPNASAYREKALIFFANAISAPADETDDTLWDGNPLSSYFVGANMFDSMATNHHGYMNVGYMVITLSNLAMLHFTLRELNAPAPELLYHNMARLWQLVRSCMFDDGRLFRIGGDTRIRYCYCQDYLVPTLLLAEDCGLATHEDCAALESGWLAQVEREVEHNGDHSFLSDRCEMLKEKSPLYYTRLESDRAVSMSYGAYLRENVMRDETAVLPVDIDPATRSILPQWHDEYHGSSMVRGENRFAAFTWVAAERPMGMICPPEDSSMAEWRVNMTSEIKGDGFTEERSVLCHNTDTYADSFATCGAYLSHTKEVIAEQIFEEDTAVTDVAFAVLPDDATVVTLQRARAVKRIHLSEVRGLKLNIPNDIFNGFKRTYDISPDAKTVTVDSRLAVGVIYGGKISLFQPDYRQIGILHRWHYETRGMLHCDEILAAGQLTPHWYNKNETVFDFAAAACLLKDGNTASDVLSGCQKIDVSEENIRAVSVLARNGKTYLVAANFGETAVETEIAGIGLKLEPHSSVMREC